MNPASSPLLTDLYQLTMLQSYMEENMRDTAVFEFFVRKRPKQRNFFIAAGLEQALDFLENLRFSADELAWLTQHGAFSQSFVDALAALRFTGEVYAMSEGTVFFPDEPILRIVAPLPEAQLVESRLINILHFQTLIASKAVRFVQIAPEKLLVDFGMRRAHGAEAALLAARASYLVGFNGSATVLAAARFGIPVYGTMAHAYIEAHDTELAAFEHFATSLPGNTVLLIDTYDTEAAAAKIVALAPKFKARSITLKAVRLDSGDLAAHAHKVRAILDAGGLKEVGIFVSGNLDETVVRDLLTGGAPIDGFGVGTHLDTSSDLPYLDCAYKLQEYAGRARRKRSEGKVTWPGRKQVYRLYDTTGYMVGDVLTLETDPCPGEALLKPVMRGGRRIAPSPPLAALREHVNTELKRLPDNLRGLDPGPAYRVQVSDALRALAAQVDNWPV